MLKLIRNITLVLCISATTALHAFVVERSEQGTAGLLHYYLLCQSGQRFIITWEPNSNQYYGLNSALYLTLDAAAHSKGCY